MNHLMTTLETRTSNKDVAKARATTHARREPHRNHQDCSTRFSSFLALAKRPTNDRVSFRQPGPPDDIGHWDQSARDTLSPSCIEQLQGRPRQCLLRLCAGSRRNAVEKHCQLLTTEKWQPVSHNFQSVCVACVRHRGGPCPSPTC